MSQAVKIRASMLGSGRERSFDDIDIGERLSKIAYEKAGLGPKDMHLAEVHDATAYGELHQAEALGFCREGEGGILAAERRDEDRREDPDQPERRAGVAGPPHRRVRASRRSTSW